MATTSVKIGERRERNRLLGALLEITDLIASDRPLPEVLEALVRTIEAQRSGLIGSILLMDPTGRRLRHGAAPNLPAAYVRAVDGIEIGPKVGSCGTAAFLGERIVVPDVTCDERWVDFRGVATKHGLRACWSQPIVTPSGKVLGTFAMYYREPRRPTADELTLIEAAARLAGIAIGRQATADALHREHRVSMSLSETIDQLTQAEEQTKQHQAELARLTQLSTMMVMAASFSHQLNQPLQAIMFHAEAALRELEKDGVDTRHVVSDLRRIIDQAHRTGKIMQRLRSMIRDDRPSEARSDVNTVVRTVTESLAPSARKAGVTIRTVLDDAVGEVAVDRLHLEQVLLNLGHNALDAMQAPGATERVLMLITERSDTDEVTITVRDTGPGLAPDIVEDAFEPFVSTKAAGLGLGLPLAKRLVELHGGTLAVTPGLRRGAEFTIVFPPPGVMTPRAAEDA